MDSRSSRTRTTRKPGIALRVYQVMLFESESYILLQGLVGEKLADEFLPEFKAMARSLVRNRK